MSVVLCLPAHLRVSTAASRGQAPHGNASVDGQRRRGDDLQQRLGMAEAQVRSLTFTPCASFTAQQGLAPQGLQSQGSGSRSGSQ